jgi:hypothetical protein
MYGFIKDLLVNYMDLVVVCFFSMWILWLVWVAMLRLFVCFMGFEMVVLSVCCLCIMYWYYMGVLGFGSQNKKTEYFSVSLQKNYPYPGGKIQCGAMVLSTPPALGYTP